MMNDGLYQPLPHHRRDGVTIPTIWVAIALSLLLHIAVMWKWLPQLRFPSLDPPASDTLVVRLSPPPGPPPTPPSSRTIPAQPSPIPAIRPSRRAVRTPQGGIEKNPPPAPPVIAAQKTTPAIPSPSPAAPATATAAPARPSSGGDLASYIETQRRARIEPAQSTEDNKTRTDRYNLSFVPKAIRYNDAEFMFYASKGDIRTAQLIKVERGNNSDIRIAVVRKVVALMRDYKQQDYFDWRSQRLGSMVSLSTRAIDNEELEDFLMRELNDFLRRNPISER